MYCWQAGLPQEPKIKEAYQMLKKQGEITSSQFSCSWVDYLLWILWEANHLRILLHVNFIPFLSVDLCGTVTVVKSQK